MMTMCCGEGCASRGCLAPSKNPGIAAGVCILVSAETWLDQKSMPPMPPPPGGIPAGGCFLDGLTGRMHRIIDAILALLHLDFGGAADADYRDAARELGETLLQLLTVVVRGGLLDLRLDLRDAGLDVGLLAGTVDDGGVLL